MAATDVQIYKDHNGEVYQVVITRGNRTKIIQYYAANESEAKRNFVARYGECNFTSVIAFPDGKDDEG